MTRGPKPEEKLEVIKNGIEYDFEVAEESLGRGQAPALRLMPSVTRLPRFARNDMVVMWLGTSPDPVVGQFIGRGKPDESGNYK